MSASSSATTSSGTFSASSSVLTTPSSTSSSSPAASPTDVGTLFSGSRSLTETSSVYINTSYTYSPTSFFSSSSTTLPTSSGLFGTSSVSSESSRDSESSSSRYRGSKTASSPASSFTARVIVPSAGQPLLQGENGLLLNLRLGGDDVGQAVYSVPMVFGHPSGSQYYAWDSAANYVDDSERRSENGRSGTAWKRRRTEAEKKKRGEDVELRERHDSSRRGKRAPGTYQSMNLQVDLGSSDLVRNPAPSAGT